VGGGHKNRALAHGYSISTPSGFGEEGCTMRFNCAELIEEFERNIRKYGGAFDEWCVGTAKDARGAFFQRHLVADLDDGLAYREAFTTTVAEAVVDHLVNVRGLEPVPAAPSSSDPRDNEAEGGSERAESADLKVGATRAADSVDEAERRSALQAVSELGKIVFVYRKTSPLAAAPSSDHAAFPRRAA
jgi:hypothetical protein